MPYDLRHQSWIPWLRRSGIIEWGPPATLVSRTATGDDFVVGIAAPRSDLAGAVQEFLIGLLSAALQPADEDEWLALWHRPPTPEALQTTLNALPPAFNLDGDGPRFFQDLSSSDFADVDAGPIEQLLIDSPGDQGVRLNKDLFVKRARVERLSRSAAAMALITLQTYAPSGGQGHRTSLRGGGPLTVLVDPRVDLEGRSIGHEQPLWRKLWANVETREQWIERSPRHAPLSLESAFPWMTLTRASNPKAGGRETTPTDAHPLQAYFGLPRRIRLVFGGSGQCDLTGEVDAQTVIGFQMINYGTQYIGWQHPLSPYYRTKPTEGWLPVHGQPGGVGWRDWLSLALDAPTSDKRKAAAAVVAFNARGGRVGVTRTRLHVFGYDLENMKPRGWTDALLPGFTVIDKDKRELLYDTAFRLVDAAGIAASALLTAVKGVLFPSGQESGDLGQVRTELWEATSEAFYDTVSALAGSSLDPFDAQDAAQIERQEFVRKLEDESLTIFDRWCPAIGLRPSVLRRRVTSRYDLAMALRGYSRLGSKLFEALQVPAPGIGRKDDASTKRSRLTKRDAQEVAQ